MNRIQINIVTIVAVIFACGNISAEPQGTGFTYQ